MLQSSPTKILPVLYKVQETNTVYSEILCSYLNDSIYNISVYCFYLGSDLLLVSENKFMGNHITPSGMINSILHG